MGGNPQSRRPSRLVVERNRDDRDDAEDGDRTDLASPLMVMSPGLSCGGLLDEKFVAAMRGAEDTGPSSHTGAIDADNHGGRGERGGGTGGGDNDDALLQALSPRSLLASPRVVRAAFGDCRKSKG